MYEGIAKACRPALVTGLTAVAIACGNSSAPTTLSTAATLRTPVGEAPVPSQVKAPAVPAGAPLAAGVHDLVPNGECPDPGPSRATAMAASASARVPLKVGLTLSSTWKAYPEDYEHECLLQVSQIDALSIMTTSSCPIGEQHKTITTLRRICWTDVLDSYLYVTQGGLAMPETLVGALQFSLSVESLAALKVRGEIHHRYIDLKQVDRRLLDHDIDGALKSDGPGTFKLIINDKVVEVPTIEANYVNFKTNDTIRVKVLDEPRFPLMLDYYIPSLHRFFITYTKVSFPTANEVEKHLAVEKHTDVYGIYFNFASDELRPESEPVLHEIADALQAHPEWTLIINGHTDNIGGDALNLDLSRRRAAAVRKALAERYRIGESRLTINGFGASQPKESNVSDRGRALNRRVELVRP